MAMQQCRYCTRYPSVKHTSRSSSVRPDPSGEMRNWFGGLVDGMRDASGQMYMRNRYYDPATGQFTQADPIGLAGGLNAFGFANGDPVTYSDPYGLAAEAGCPPICNDSNLRHLELEVERASNVSDGEFKFAVGALAVVTGGPLLSRLGGALLGRLGIRGAAGASDDAIRFTAREVDQLRGLFGQGGDDAIRKAADLSSVQIPRGISAQTLRNYRAVAERALNPGSGKRVTDAVRRVQQARIRIVDEALRRMDY